jgi:hypothetical protein
VVRLKRDVGKESSVGFLGTSYNFIEKHNQLAGFDGRFKLDPQTVFSFQALGTSSRRCFFQPAKDEHQPKITEPCFGGFQEDLTAPHDPLKLTPNSTRNYYRTGNGFGYFYNYDKSKRHFSLNISGQGRTRDYRAESRNQRPR